LRSAKSYELAQRVLKGQPLAEYGEHDVTLTRLAGILAQVCADIGAPFDAGVLVSRRSLEGMGWGEGWEHLVKELRKKFDRALEQRRQKDDAERAVNEFWEAELATYTPANEDDKLEEATAQTWKEHLIKKKNADGETIGIKDTERNAELIFQFDPDWAGKLRFNLMTKEMEWGTPGKGPLGKESSKNTWGIATVTWLQGSKYKISLKQHVLEALLMRTARRNEYDPVQEALRALPKWDGVPRPLLSYMNSDTERPELTSKMLRKFLIGAVARAMQPGCEMQNILILEAEYGAGKSSLAKILSSIVPNSYAEVSVDPHNKDSMALASRYWIVELGEMAGTKKADRESMKLFISKRVDSYRPPYGRHLEDFPRRSVFIGSTNDDQYLAEANRREWCVRSGPIDKEKLRRDVEQIWAEALQAYEAGEQWHLDKPDERAAMEVAREAQQVDMRGEAIKAWFAALKPADRPPHVSLMDVATTILRTEVSASALQHANGLSFVLKTIGFVRRKVRHGKQTTWRWVTPAQILQEEQSENAAKEMSLFN
jgi:predicted P-loop ATPase